MKPIIGISIRLQDKELFTMRAAYVNAVRHAGGLPMLFPMTPNEDIDQYVSVIDGYIIPGGADMTPLLYGEQPHPNVKRTFHKVDEMEIAVMRECLRQGKPLMGICRGQQVINVCLGGTLYQDLPSQTQNEICHYQGPANRSEATHTVHIQRESLLCNVLGKEEMLVNSFHHQAIRALGGGLRVAAKALDGTIEAVESADGLIMGVQWHPEEMHEVSEDALALFVAFVKRCSLKKKRGE